MQSPFLEGRSVLLSFPSHLAPERIVFVLREMEPEAWINNGSCYTIQLRAPGLEKILASVLTAEASAEHWTLKDRFVLANETLDGFVAAGCDGMAFFFTWLRMSSNRLLTWARRSAYQSKDIAWMQKVIAERVSDKVRR